MTDNTEQLQKIAQLNLVDRALIEIQEKKEAIPVTQQALESDWGAFKQKLDEKKMVLAEIEKNKRSRELDLQSSQESVKQKEARLYEIKTNKEYQAAQKEIEDTRKTNKALEDQILAGMTQLEEATKAFGELSEKEPAKAKEFQDEMAKLKNLEAELGSQAELEEASRKQILASLTPEIVAKYNHVRKYRTDAIAFLEGRSCLGCYRNLPPQLYNQVLKKDTVFTCPTCNRILCLQEEKKEEAKKE